MWLRQHDNSAHKYPNAADRDATDLETSKNRKGRQRPGRQTTKEHNTDCHSHAALRMPSNTSDGAHLVCSCGLLTVGCFIVVHVVVTVCRTTKHFDHGKWY